MNVTALKRCTVLNIVKTNEMIENIFRLSPKKYLHK